MTANAWQVFDIFLEQVGAEAHNLNATDSIKMALITSSWTPNTATDVTFATIDANEISNAGYTAGGSECAATWAAATGTLTFDLANVTWTASEAAITARYAVLYNTASGETNDLIAYSLLDNSPADVSASDGNDFIVNFHASGAFTIAQS